MRTSIYIISLALVCCCSKIWAQDTLATNPNITNNNIADTLVNNPTDSTQNIKQKKPQVAYQPQLRFLFDIGNFAFNFADESRTSYEFSLDYQYKNSWYLVAEMGYAKGNIDYENLKYKTNSGYLRIGGDKSLLQPISDRDFDIVFFGFRYGAAIGQRTDATFIVPSSFGPSREGSMPAQDFFVHWGEMTGGIRVEMWKGIYAGWNFRAKFMLNSKTFENKLTPNYIAGYGKADKGTSFGFNVYLGYAIQWQQKKAK